MIDPALIEERPLLADGDPADHLRRTHPGDARPPEGLNLLAPRRVQAAHEAYVKAGALMIRTNTAQATALALAPHGLDARAEAVNNSGSAAVRAALAAVAPGGQGVMMGTLGELPPRRGPQPSREEKARAYEEQIVYLSDTGVDCFVLQHFTHLAEALLVTARVKRVSDAPVMAQLTLDADGRTADGHACAEAAARLRDAGADALGLSCGPAAESLPPLLEPLLRQDCPVSVLAGIAGPGGRTPYPGAPVLSPSAFAEAVGTLAGEGVHILGGCCGVTPAHLRALARRLGRIPPAG